jgi:thioesterase domain-containing protein/acyl carrier protein
MLPLVLILMNTPSTLSRTRWTEAALRGLLIDELSRMLEVDSAELDSSRSFDEYGLDSIDAVIATGWFGEQLGIDLPPELLFRHTSVDRVVQALLNGDYDESPSEIQEGKRTLIFLFPGAGGRDEQALIRFRAECPKSLRFEVVRIGDWRAWIEQEVDFEEIVTRVRLHIEEVAADTPFLLAGYSQGGQLAYATAFAMERAGRPVKFVGLLDSSLRGPALEASTKKNFIKSTMDGLRVARQVIAARMHGNRSPPGASRIRMIAWLWPMRREAKERKKLHLRAARLGRLFGYGSGGVRISVSIQMRLFWELWNAWLTENGSSKSLRAPVVLFRAEGPGNRDLGWGAFCSDLTIVPVAGNHYTMMDEHHVEELVDLFAKAAHSAVEPNERFEKAISKD